MLRATLTTPLPYGRAAYTHECADRGGRLDLEYLGGYPLCPLWASLEEKLQPGLLLPLFYAVASVRHLYYES